MRLRSEVIPPDAERSELATVERVTPSGRLRLSNGEIWRKDRFGIYVLQGGERVTSLVVLPYATLEEARAILARSERLIGVGRQMTWHSGHGRLETNLVAVLQQGPVTASRRQPVLRMAEALSEEDLGHLERIVAILREAVAPAAGVGVVPSPE